jgi:hypothetical protein
MLLHEEETNAQPGWTAMREIDAVAALDQQELWDQIDAWIDGRLRPAASIGEAVAELP